LRRVWQLVGGRPAPVQQLCAAYVRSTRPTRRHDALEVFGEGKEGVGPPSLFDSGKAEITKMLANDTFRRFKDGATKAQHEMGQDTDWDNIEGRERS
jgi:hypothetical protein